VNVLQVSTYDRGGGAEAVANRLFKACEERGLGAMMAVGTRFSQDAAVRAIPREMPRGAWRRLWTAAAGGCERYVGKVKGAGWLRQRFLRIAQPARWLARLRGIEDFHHPGTWKLLELFDQRPDLVHCHNLHGPYDWNLMRAGYFDLSALPWLCREVPVLLTLHDAWLLSGHCAHSFDCQRWRTGCGKCPDLTIYPSIARDATAKNWLRKQGIFAQCRLYVATPSEWLMDKVRQSILAPAILESRVIHNGVDRRVFCPGDRKAARDRLGLPTEPLMLLTAATALRANVWKDYATLEKAVRLLSASEPERAIILVGLGSDSPVQRQGRLEIRFVPFVTDPREVAAYHQAADVFVHAARADTFPTAVLEALSSGRPVVASAIGGIPEQIVSGKTGLLAPPGDAVALAAALGTLAGDAELRRAMGAAAAADAAVRFDEREMFRQYCQWYEDIHAQRQIDDNGGADA
jgi:glycosyltransferase involved in cell wall biosynthesis